VSDLVRSKTGGRRFRTTRELGKREERGKEERIDGRKTFASRAYSSCKKCRQSAWHLRDAAGRQPESREDTVERPDEKRKGQTEGVEGKKEGKGIWVSSTFSSFLPSPPFRFFPLNAHGPKAFFPSDTRSEDSATMSSLDIHSPSHLYTSSPFPVNPSSHNSASSPRPPSFLPLSSVLRQTRLDT